MTADPRAHARRHNVAMWKATLLIAGPTVLYIALGVLRRMLF